MRTLNQNQITPTKVAEDICEEADDISTYYDEDEPPSAFNDKTLTDDSINAGTYVVERHKENNRHNEVLHTLKAAESLVTISITLLFIIWIISVWLSADQQKYTSSFTEILKIVIMTTIGFICGNRMKS